MGSVDDVKPCKQWVGDLYKCESGLISGPQNSNKHVIGTRKSGRNLWMVVLSDRSLSGTLLYL